MPRHTDPTPPAAETVALSALTPDPRNARRHPERNLATLEASLREVGAARSIVVDESGVVLAGNATVEAAGRVGVSRVRVVDADGTELVAVRRTGLTDEQKRRLALFDSRTAELAVWDADVLASLADDTDLSGLWADDELAGLLAGLAEEPSHLLGDPDDVPEVPESPVTRPGDLWRLGEHRLLCGDSTSESAVARLMRGQLAALVVTDPPYGVAYAGGTTPRAPLAGDHRGTSIYADALPIIAAVAEPTAALYLWHAGAESLPVLEALAASGYAVRAQLIWTKNQAQFGALGAQYKQQHEPCFYCHRHGHAPRWYGPTNAVTVWAEDRARRNDLHPTQKPVALAARAIANSSRPGELVLDPFGGSGSTLVACAQLGRRGAVMELEPGYCDVIVTRWEALTGKTAERVSAVTEEDAA